MRYSTHWHYLPASVQDQARARWPSGERAAGPGDWYQYQYEMVDDNTIHQMSLFPISNSYGHVRRVARLVGRRKVTPTPPTVRLLGNRFSPLKP